MDQSSLPENSDENKLDDEEQKAAHPKPVNHTISEVKVGDIPGGKSIFVTPKRMDFKQNGRARKWDLVESMSAVAVLCYHTEKKAFLFVKQFRPPVYYNRMKQNKLNEETFQEINNEHSKHQIGCTVECIAGLLDKEKLTPLQTAMEELKEEVGYAVPEENLVLISKYRQAVGIIGSQTTIYFAKIDESMRIGDGGGSIEENECIELVWIPVRQSKQFVLENDDIPPGLKFAVFWFYFTYPELCKDMD